MLKARSVIWGIIASAVCFALLIMAEVFVSDKLKSSNIAVLTNLAYIFALISVTVGAMVSAFSARGRGLIYGAVVALAWIFCWSVIALLLDAESVQTVVIRVLGLFPAGVLGGGAGILISNKNEYL